LKRKNPALIYILMVLLLADVLCSALMLYNYDQNKCFAILIVTALLVVCFVTVFLVYSGNSLKHISKMNSHLESSAAEYMNSLPAPVAVVDENGTVVWYNRIFSESIAFGNDIFGMDIGSCVTVDINAVRNDGFSLCSVNGCFYRISAEKFDKGDISFLVLYFHDETDYFNLKRITDETHPVVLIINIDNYDEIMQNAKESEKAKTSVETEQLIENFMADSNGTVKKISANTFYAILENKHVNEIITDKFKILDSARAIKVGEKNSLTLSIGVGQGASSISESEKYARQCLDMALGRGGDQAVVKTDNGFRFFGGVSNGVEKKSRAKTRIIAHTLQELISNCNTVYIMGHSFGDLDSVGSSVGLAGAVKLLGKQVKPVALPAAGKAAVGLLHIRNGSNPGTQRFCLLSVGSQREQEFLFHIISPK